ncbi:MAG: hypothetical protein EAZ95_02710 [Bacteroidetes bacterium]|nr:MAG: hypothetical protein EAZ95_02710 [Bacteroidota bacterium]
MKKSLAYLLLCFWSVPLLYAQNDLTTHFEKTNGTETVTYQQGIEFLEMLDKQFACITLQTVGKTDVGKPLHYAILSLDGDFDLASLHKKGKTILLINNNIHAGEPDGVDASLMLFRDIARQTRQEPRPPLVKAMQDIVLVMIPFYNVGGVLNRNSTSRVNQVGPKAYGFRGNAQNYDLNRDFIKQDTENARTFAELFHLCKPHLYLENHTTNGADYQYVITYLATQPEKLGGKAGEYMRQTLIPDLEKRMQALQVPISPYVTAFSDTPDKGFGGFLDSPRYSSGYTSLFGTLSFIVESHMLKPFKQRVEGTYKFMQSVILHAHENGEKIRATVQAQKDNTKTEDTFALSWKADKKRFRTINFLGYEPIKLKSNVTGLERTFYDRSKPIERPIQYFDAFAPDVVVQKPLAYIIPQGWQEVITRLQRNGVKLQRLTQDVRVEVEAYYIDSYETAPRPFEGHYLHSQVQARKETQTVSFLQGDYAVFVGQASNRYIVETLEPQGVDSFFAWNFFDSILQQKEYFSDYVFEEIAEKLLADNPDLRQRFEAKRQEDAEFAKSANKQLDFIYKNSPYYEKTHLRYPVFRLEKEVRLPLE